MSEEVVRHSETFKFQVGSVSFQFALDDSQKISNIGAFAFGTSLEHFKTRQSDKRIINPT